MKKILLIGSNIKNSLSPDIHNFIYKQLNLNAHYEIHEIEKPSQINNIIKQILNDNIYGINITAPYKSHIIDKVKLISKKAKKIGAINCIDSNLKGYNTDSYGFMKMLSKNNINLSKKNIHIIGSGGASQAILYALDIIGNKSITMYDRENVNQIITSNLNNDDVVVNCTPVHFINENNDFFDFFIQHRKPCRILWPGNVHDRWCVFPVAIHSWICGTVEEGVERVIFFRGNRVEFVVMARCATRGQPHPYFGHG